LGGDASRLSDGLDRVAVAAHAAHPHPGARRRGGHIATPARAKVTLVTLRRATLVVSTTRREATVVALPPTPIDQAQTIAARLEAARVAHRDAQEIAGRAAKLFRETIIEALDVIGLPQKQVAEMAGVSRARLHAIIAREYSRP
jgi:hypothetical protein